MVQWGSARFCIFIEQCISVIAISSFSYYSNISSIHVHVHPFLQKFPISFLFLSFSDEFRSFSCTRTIEFAAAGNGRAMRFERGKRWEREERRSCGKWLENIMEEWNDGLIAGAWLFFWLCHSGCLCNRPAAQLDSQHAVPPRHRHSSHSQSTSLSCIQVSSQVNNARTSFQFHKTYTRTPLSLASKFQKWSVHKALLNRFFSYNPVFIR